MKERGWSITAIANDLGRDRKMIRAYLNGERAPGVRARSAPDRIEHPSFLTSSSATATTRTSGRAPCSTRSSRSAARSTTRASLVRRAWRRSIRTVKRVRVSRDATPSRSFTHRARRFSGTGSNVGVFPGDRRPTCSWAHCPTRVGSGARSVNQWISPT